MCQFQIKCIFNRLVSAESTEDGLTAETSLKIKTNFIWNRYLIYSIFHHDELRLYLGKGNNFL